MNYPHCKFCGGNGCLACPGERKKDTNAIPDIMSVFNRPNDYNCLLNDRYWLVTGQQGAGKTRLFNWFIKDAARAKRLAKPLADISHIKFIPGHDGRYSNYPLLSNAALKEYINKINRKTKEPVDWSHFWTDYTLLQIASAFPGILDRAVFYNGLTRLARKSNPTEDEIVEFLVGRYKFILQSVDELSKMYRLLKEHEKHVWLFYDGLDMFLGEDLAGRNLALETLLFWWITRSRLENVIPKIFLDIDVWEGLNFTNKGHFDGKTIKLKDKRRNK